MPEVKADIHSLGLGDRVLSKWYGIGEVIKCTELPSVTVKYTTETRTYKKTLPEDLINF